MQFKTLADKAEWALKLVRSGEPMAYDTETSGLDYKRNWPIGYVFTDVNKVSVYIPVRHGGGGNLRGCRPLETPEGPFELHPFEVQLAKAFRDRRALTIGHNLKFDWHMSQSAGIALNDPLYCTQFGAALLDEYAMTYSLEHSAAVRGLTPKKSEEMYSHMGKVFKCPPSKDLMGRFWELSGDDPVAVDYAEGDGVTTIELWQAQMPEIQEQGITTVMRMENDLIRHVGAMERRGVRIDEARIDWLEEQFKQKMVEAMSHLPPGFNSRAPTQMKKMFDEAGLTNYPRTELGNPSFKEKWLKKSELGRRVVQVRKVRTILDQFIEPLKVTHIFEGRVHTNFNQLRGDKAGGGVEGVGPGRFSSSSPNLQQVPKHNKELAELYRSIFIADEGYEFWEGDYSQCEPRLFAHYAKVPILLDGYNDGTLDMHDATAQMLEVDRDTIAKRMNMGLLTGMWPKSFATHMGWEYNKALSMFKAYFRAYPEIQDFQDAAKDRFLDTGYVKTILGRRCRLEAPKWSYRATSRIIQGSNADILKYMLLKAAQLAEQSDNALQLLLTVHDSFEWQALKGSKGLEASRALVEEISDVQGPPFKLRVPFVMDVKKGRSWSDATFGKKLLLNETGAAA